MARLQFVATRPVAITMFILALTVFGGVSLGRLPMDLLPEISYPTLTVRTAFPGAAPEDVEDRVSIRIQEALSTLPGLVRTTSISRAGFSDVTLEFDWGTRMTMAVPEVRDKLDGVRLPNAAERPLILRYDPNLDPILRIGLRPPGDGALSVDEFVRLRWLAEKRIKRELETLDGVAAVQVRGGLTEEVLVQVDPDKLAAHDLDPSTLSTRLTQENLNTSGGQIREGSTDYLVRALGEFKSVEEIRELGIVRRGNAVIRVRDVATVTRTHAKREVITRLDGIEAVEIAIYREAGANIVKVAETVRNAVFGTPKQQELAKKKTDAGRTRARDLTWDDRQQLGFLAWNLRDEGRLELLSDQSTFIGAAIKDVRDAALIGALLAIAVMWVFLRRVSATAIIGLAIPISVVVTFAPMFLMGVSMNIMSLGGLALGVGMLVDNAIVVLESVMRCRDEGDNLQRAAVRGASEVAGAITASTLTTVAVFAPIVFVHGIAGQIFGDQAVTVVTSLLVSLLVAVLFIPMLASRPWMDVNLLESDDSQPRHLLRIPAHLRGLRYEWTAGQVPSNLLHLIFVGLGGLLLVVVLRIAMFLLGVLSAVFTVLTWPLRVSFDTCWRGLEKLYPRILAGALAQPLLVLAATAGLAWFAWERAQHLGLELLPEIHQGEFTAHVGLAIGTPIEHSDRVFMELDRELRAIEGVELTAVTVGVEKDTLTREIEGEHTARMTVRLDPEHSSEEAELRVAGQVRAVLHAHPEVRSVDVTRPTPFALDAPVEVEVRGHDLVVLAEVAEQVRSRLNNIDGLTDVRTSVRPGHPEARVTFDRDKTLQYGLDLAQVSGLIRDQVQGTVGTRFVEGEERIDIRVKADEAVLATIADVQDLIVNPTSASTNPVRLRAVATIDEVRGPAEIRRIGNSRAVVVSAASTGLDLGGLTTRIEAALSDLRTPGDVSVELGGQKREMDKGTRSMQGALLLAIFLVYVVMASQFESLLQPFIILFSVPLAGVGVVLVLDALQIPLSVVAFIGLILLAGIVVNNAIVLVDRINQQRAAGMNVRDALLEAGSARLRPILMTTATTVLGLLPLTGWLAGIPWLGQFGAGEGAEMRAPMAITVIAGLTSSTLLTLVVIPVIYRLVSRDRPPLEPQTEGEGAA
jgi:hydrophobic/amphiphilic exporter-1 (mainly G- bacteria), HAE1 family